MNNPGNISDFLVIFASAGALSGEALAKYVSENLSIGRIDGLGGGEDALYG